MKKRTNKLLELYLSYVSKNEDQIIEEYRQKGIDLNKDKQQVLSFINYLYLEEKKRKAEKFVKSFETEMNKINENAAYDNGLNYALAARRGTKNNNKDIPPEDKQKLEIIKKIRKKMENE